MWMDSDSLRGLTVRNCVLMLYKAGVGTLHFY